MFPVSRAASPPTPVPVAIKLAAAPVSSPDQAVTALATVDMVHDGAKITLTLLDATSAAVAQQGSVTVPGVPHDANVLVTPVFAPGSAIVSLVLAITMPVGKRLVRKAHPRTGSLSDPVGDDLDVASCAGLFRSAQRGYHGTVPPFR